MSCLLALARPQWRGQSEFELRHLIQRPAPGDRDIGLVARLLHDRGNLDPVSGHLFILDRRTNSDRLIEIDPVTTADLEFPLPFDASDAGPTFNPATGNLWHGLITQAAQLRLVNTHVPRRLHKRNAPIPDQAHRLKLELACELPPLRDPTSKHLTRCLRNRVQAIQRFFLFAKLTPISPVTLSSMKRMPACSNASWIGGRRNIGLHHPLTSLKAPNRRQSSIGGSREIVLSPAEKSSCRSDLLGLKHPSSFCDFGLC